MAIFGVLRMAPWWRGPGLLLRRPGVAAGLIAAAVVAALPAAAAGPFLSSSRDATLHHQIQEACPSWVGARIATFLYFADPYGYRDTSVFDGPAVAARRERIADAAAARVPGLATGAHTVLTFAYADNAGIPLYLVSRTDATANVDVLDGPQGDGVWITDEYAKSIGVAVGNTVAIHAHNNGAPGTPVRVAAIYKSLRQSPDQPFWCTMIPLYRPPDTNQASPQMFLLDEATNLRLGGAENLTGRQFLEYPLRDSHLSQDEAQATVVGVAQLEHTVHDGAPRAFDEDVLSHTAVASELTGFVGRAELARRGMLPAVLPITAAGILVGLLVLAAATTFWVRRRRQELTILAARGVGPASLGAKAILEALPAVLLGTLVGWGGAWELVRFAGPDPVLSGEAAPWAMAGAAVALTAGVIVTGFVATLAARSLTDQVRSRRHRLIRTVPWELVPLALTPFVWNWLGDQRELSDQPGGFGSVAYVPSRLLIVPILFVGAAMALAGRLGARYLRLRGPRLEPRRPAVFLGWRRICRQPVMTAVLTGATAVPIALAAYGATVTGSVNNTIADEARLRVGSDVVMTLAQPVPVPPSLADHATLVLRRDGALIGGIQTDVLAVDPVAFARDAYWDDRLGGSLATLLAPLQEADGGGQVVVSAAPVPPGEQVATWAGVPLLGGTATVVGVRTLPAEVGSYPVTVVNSDALGSDAQYAIPQLWARGNPDDIIRAAQAAHLPITSIQRAEDLYFDSLWEPMTFTFAYLTALSLLTGVVTVVGLLLYLESQTPSHRRAYVMLRRMGLRSGSHARAVLGELALPLALGLLGGLAAAFGLTAELSPSFDMNPRAKPDVVVAIPYPTLALISAAVVVIAVVVSGYAHRRIARAKPGEVLRDAP